MATLRTTLSDPSPGAHRPGVRRLAVAVLVSAGVALAPLPASAAPGDPATSQAAADLLAARAHDLEKLTEQFDTARDGLERQQAASRTAAGAAGQASTRLVAARREVRGIARSAYAGGGLSDLGALLAGNSPADVVERVRALGMVSRHQGQVLRDATAEAAAAAQADAGARGAAEEARVAFDEVSAQERALQAQIDEYRAAYDRLSAQEKRAAMAPAAGRASRADRAALVDPVAGGSQAAQVAVRTAMAQLGKPYVWGAAGPDSFDCSGLVQYAYQAAGVGLPHSAAAQATMGRPVTRAELQPGDLVAFYSPVSHIGIYVGDGRMIHAPSSGDVVQVASIDAVGGITAMRRIAG